MTGLHHRSLPNLNELPNLNAPSKHTPDNLELALRQQNSLEHALRLESSTFDDVFWINFEKYLKNNYGKKTIYDRLLYAKKYAHVLQESNAQDLLALNLDKQKHAMKALAVLSKYLGCYEKWKQIKQNYQLKWSNGDSLQFFENFFDNNKNYSIMVNWLKDVCQKLPKQYGNTLKYCTLTGLRAEEACRSIQLLHSDRQHYFNQDSLILEHYKFPDSFLRKTKKAYVSIANEQILELAEQCGNLSYSAMSCYVRRHGLEMRMKYCRKIFSTHLRREGIEAEIIDLLQGRVPKSVFARHYFRPDFRPDKIRTALDSLYATIT